MIIRSFDPSDLEELKQFHEKYFADQFNFPDFMHFICAFVVEDEKGIIAAGGVRDIAEGITVTNMERHPVDRMKAIYQLLDASIFVCNKSEYDQIYIWSHRARWTNRLMRMGFRLPQGESLLMDL